MCTGNRCRSPVALAALARGAKGRGLVLRSVGISSIGPLPPPPETISAARSLGLDISHHRAAGLRLDDLQRSDLIIGFEQRHIATAVVEGKARHDRAFLLTELVGLLAELPDDQLRVTGRVKERMGKILEAAHRARSSHPEPRLEIPDPMGRGANEHARVAKRIGREVTQLGRLLFRPPPPPPT